MTTFVDFMREIEREAEAGGPEVMAELREFIEWYRQTRKTMKMSALSVREHPLVAEYLVTIEAPSQATPDAEMKFADTVCRSVLTRNVEALSDSLVEIDNLHGYRVRIDPLAIGPKCAACSRSVLEQVVAAARSNTECIEAMQRTDKHRGELLERVRVLEEENEKLRRGDQ